MVFSSSTFLFYFLPLTLAAYTVVPTRARNALLLAASLVFYVWGSGWHAAALVISIVVDYVAGFPAERAARTNDRKLKRLAVGISVASNLALLAWFKYATWLFESASDAGFYSGEIPQIVLPIGISFFTFQSMSYTIDVARGRSHHLANPIDFALYVSFFPQLIAGPIVRFHEIEQYIRKRTYALDGVGEGALRFSHGLVKKVVVADSIAPIADAAFSTDPGDLSTLAAWVGVIAFTMQIYFDFSGYSDMAIGLGRMFGFRFPENFNRPYSALSVTDFWRRWHITLSNWFRDYLYIPLGGSQMATSTGVYRNLIIVFFLTGLWHGANWTFVVWGLYHGGWLLFERATSRRYLDTDDVRTEALLRARTLLVVVVGWVFFRADTLSYALDYLGAMFSPGTGGLDPLSAAVTGRAMVMLVLASTVALLPRTRTTGPRLVNGRDLAAGVERVAVMFVGLPLALLLAASGAYSPFLYFEF